MQNREGGDAARPEQPQDNRPDRMEQSGEAPDQNPSPPASAQRAPRCSCNPIQGVIFTAFFTLVSSASPSYAQQATTKDQVIGSWRVLSLKATTGDKVTYPLGEQVAGYVTITPTRFWLLFVDATRKAPAAPALTDAEAIAMMKTQVAWTGKYTTAEQTAEGIKLTARVDAASSQAIFDTDRVYFIRVDGNKMMVKSPGVIVPMTGATSIVEFELVRSD